MPSSVSTFTKWKLRPLAVMGKLLTPVIFTVHLLRFCPHFGTPAAWMQHCNPTAQEAERLVTSRSETVKSRNQRGPAWGAVQVTRSEEYEHGMIIKNRDEL